MERVQAFFWGRRRTGTVVSVSKRIGQKRPAIGVVFDDPDMPIGLRGRVAWFDRSELEATQ